jgi:hypothetical protein
MAPMVSDVAEDLTRVVSETLPAFEAIDEDGSLQTRGPGTWSRKQILGHLVDSALNNVHRFVRAPLEEDFVFPDYDQPAWVAAGGYQDRSWSDLIRFWADLNCHLAEVIRRIPPAQLATLCRLGGSEPVTLEFLVQDYMRHMRHHLQQILDPEGSRGKTHPPFARDEN